jgi:hypothetical protein
MMTSTQETQETRKSLVAGIVLGVVANLLTAGATLCYILLPVLGVLAISDRGLMQTVQTSGIAACVVCPVVVNGLGIGFSAVTKRRKMLLGWLIGGAGLSLLLACLGLVGAVVVTLLLSPGR